MDADGYGYWVGALNEAGSIGGHGKLLQEVAGKDAFMKSAGADFVYDIVRARKETEMFVDPQDSEVILPVAGAIGNQLVNFQGDGIGDSAVTGQWEYDFFRIDRPVRISSEYPLLLGRPVQLGHHGMRRKFVLNILVDALSWSVLRRQGSQYMPHVMEFFSKGVVFDQHFSVAEYTYPSLASIETGMYPHHSQIYHDGLVVRLDEEYVTMSERMKDLGYYCVNIMGGASGGLYNGVTRGYDRLLVGAYDLPAYSAAERTIRHLEAFSECDQFLFLHILELHPWSSRTNRLDVGVQTKLSLRDRMNGKEEIKPSVYLPGSNCYQRAYQQAMARIDRSLGVLFDYITSHYDEDEYIIQLYSDHGATVYDDVPQLVGDSQTHAAYMLRGYGVPRKGIVDELTSAVDIYPVLGKLAGFPVGSWVDGNLPAVFGGEERTCVYSNSRYPGQTYKLCIRTKDHEFYMESLNPVHEDGTVDLSGAETSVYFRDGSHRLVENPVLTDEFLGMAREYTHSFNDEGRHWHSYR
ncbi:MAG: sulfatase-like hydrolase/transferase [Selenomonadaceae bacterium]|nr:sulfatase-like hydrolase/transferase [Selenomonadaceae bacterium]